MMHSRINNLKSLDDIERIRKIMTFVWVGYTYALSIIDEFNILMNTPERDRMPGLLLFGPSNNGKTAILKQFLKMHPEFITKNDEKINIPVIYFRVYKTDEKSFFTTILDTIGSPYGIQESKSLTVNRAVHLLKKVNVKFILIDEFHNILNTANRSQQRHFLTTLKEFANEIKVPIVICGTDEARFAIDSDINVSRRFDKIELSPWQLDNDYIRLLMSFEKILPLKENSNLHNQKVAEKIYSMSRGILGETKTVIDRAAILAIKSGTEKITFEILNSIRYNYNDRLD
ncbi:TniB family NTP-binding protein [Flavobacterium sp. C4GT6]|uniref:TniB family NTP-binding protein n=1 Tax=Flavobacterium sp. C4GT6 TaxID=3103818 RepID=UPI002ED3E327